MTVYLVGAGPGDPRLITVRGAEVLARAQVVVHDRLAEARLLDLAPAAAERIDVGKSPGGPVDQDAINRLLVDRGKAGREVVRLKGGDPFVLGRGGEEVYALLAAGVPFEVVPGVPSVVAAPAYAGVPLTHRGLSRAFTVVSGHSLHDLDEAVNWEALAALGGTIVVLMGVAHRGEIARRLMEGGLAPSTAVLAVTWGTRPEQCSLRTTLERLGDEDVQPPATMVIGPVASLDFGWYERLPLFGKRVVVTRTSDQAKPLCSRLSELGARAIEVATIRIGSPSDAGVGLRRAADILARGGYAWAAFTSANAVDALMEMLRDCRAFASTLVAAIGPGTADALGAWGLMPDLVPAEAVGEALLAEMPAAPREGGTVLLAQAARARPVLAEGLAKAGWTTDVVEAYRTVPAEPSEEALDQASEADAICFTSSSTVTHYLALAAGRPVPPVVVCLGPVAAATAREAGLEVAAVAEPHTVAGLVEALVRVLA
ncbi:MAG: uroporphyrinogen-III C-methyltransferase [Acidimicrobiales bacterium]